MRFPTSLAAQHIRQFTFILATCALTAAYAPVNAQVATPISPPAASSSQPASSKLGWDSLSPQQKLALGPLSPEWDKMDQIRKKKWLEIANKFAAMTPDEQVRVQERMRTWMKLTPEQRMEARENFARTTQIKPEQKSAQWQQYQQLSDEQKKQLANEASKKKSITNLPPESQRNVKPLAPIKAGPKPVASAPLTPLVPSAQPVSTVQPVQVPPPTAPAAASAASSIPAPQSVIK